MDMCRQMDCRQMDRPFDDPIMQTDGQCRQMDRPFDDPIMQTDGQAF
jgi:hypothetical protein